MASSFLSLMRMTLKPPSIKYIDLCFSDKNSGSSLGLSEINQLFVNLEKPLTVLLQGEAGSGKSTFVENALYFWVQKQLWTQVNHVFLVKIRDLSNLSNKYLSLDEVIAESCINQASEVMHIPNYRQLLKKEITEILRGKSNEVLLILDGYDERDYSPPMIISFIEKIMNRDPIVMNEHQKELTSCLFYHIVLTSRPMAINCPLNKRIEILGFSHDNIRNFIANQFTLYMSDVGQKLFQHLQKISLFEFCKNPLVLKMVCYFSENLQLIDKVSSLTGIYSRCLNVFFQKYFIFYTKKDHEQLLQKLSMLAFLKLNKSNDAFGMQIDQNTLQECHISQAEVDKMLEKEQELSILKKSSCGTYVFSHLTLQEYLTAKYIADNFDNNKNIIEEKCFDFKYRKIFIFLSGMLNINDFLNFFQVIKKKSQEFNEIGGQIQKMLLSCLDEISEENFQKIFSNFIIKDFIEKELCSHSIKTDISDVLRMSHNLQNIIKEQIIPSFDEFEEAQKMNWIRLIGRLGGKVDPDIIYFLENLAFTEKYQQYKSLVFHSFYEIALFSKDNSENLKEITNIILNKGILQNEDIKLRNETCKMFHSLSVSENEVLKVVGLLEKIGSVWLSSQESLLESLSKMQLTERILIKILSLYDTQNNEICKSFIIEICMRNFHDIISEVLIETIFQNLGEEEYNLESRKLEALKTLFQKLTEEKQNILFERILKNCINSSPIRKKHQFINAVLVIFEEFLSGDIPKTFPKIKRYFEQLINMLDQLKMPEFQIAVIDVLMNINEKCLNFYQFDHILEILLFKFAFSETYVDPISQKHALECISQICQTKQQKFQLWSQFLKTEKNFKIFYKICPNLKWEVVEDVIRILQEKRKSSSKENYVDILISISQLIINSEFQDLKLKNDLWKETLSFVTQSPTSVEIGNLFNITATFALHFSTISNDVKKLLQNKEMNVILKCFDLLKRIKLTKDSPNYISELFSFAKDNFEKILIEFQVKDNSFNENDKKNFVIALIKLIIEKSNERRWNDDFAKDYFKLAQDFYKKQEKISHQLTFCFLKLFSTAVKNNLSFKKDLLGELKILLTNNKHPMVLIAIVQEYTDIGIYSKMTYVIIEDFLEKLQKNEIGNCVFGKIIECLSVLMQNSQIYSTKKYFLRIFKFLENCPQYLIPFLKNFDFVNFSDILFRICLEKENIWEPLWRFLLSKTIFYSNMWIENSFLKISGKINLEIKIEKQEIEDFLKKETDFANLKLFSK